MSKKLLAVLMGCAVALCLGLVGCGGSGGGGAAQEEAPNVVGVWDIENVDELLAEAGVTSDETMTDAMKKVVAEVMPEICFMNVNEDGTFQLVAMGQKVEGTWEVDGSTMALTAEGSTIEGTLDGTTLALESGGTKMVFAKSGDTAREVLTEEEMQEKITELVLASIA